MRRRRKRMTSVHSSRQEERPYSHGPLAAAAKINAPEGYHASTLNRTTVSQSNGDGGLLLQLQRQYGNRYVQRVLARSRQASGETGSSSVVQAQGEGKKDKRGQLVHLRQASRGQRKFVNGFGSSVKLTSPLQVSRQGLLTAAEETSAINFSRRYDERSVRIIQIITGTNVDGNFGRLTAEAVAAFQDANGLTVDGKVGENTLDVMVPNRVAANRREHAIQLIADFHNLDVTSDTLTIHFDPAIGFGSLATTTFESGNLRVIRLGPLAFLTARVLRFVIERELAVPAPAAAPVGPRPTHLNNAEELAAIRFNRGRFQDRRAVLAFQGIVGTGLDGIIGRDTVERIAEFQNANGLTVDGKIGQDETLPAMVNQLIAAANQNAAIRMIVDFFDIRDDGNLLDVRFDPTVAANAATDFRPNEPVRVRIGPGGLAQPFAGIVHTIAHEFEHVRRLKEGIAPAATHEFLGEAIEILSVGMPEEDLEAVAPGAPGFIAGFADDAGRALVNWNAMPLADRQRFRGRFIAVRQRVRDRVAAGTPAQQALHAPLVAAYNAVVLPPP
jgi:peptidoglycan hydrolase-like protein with peptidoglycan-binding domain